MKKNFYFLLMAALVCGLSLSVTSCKDETSWLILTLSKQTSCQKPLSPVSVCPMVTIRARAS